MEKISIIVPIYNSEKTLKSCLKSILNQTYKNLDIILIDDGSTDKRGEICNYYQIYKWANTEKYTKIVYSWLQSKYI